ncbi:MAG: hypothetical protein BMS9Abin36_1160 [Gammaproteobacteria bacterium]|nr:MAG: hypothetical protein BMS9Abin36_1160 [Gammaproteobacteria bacterium]
MNSEFLKTYKTALVGILLVAGLNYTAISSADEDDSKKGNFVRGARAWADNCLRCHNVRDPKELRDDQWVTTTFHMRVRGGLTGQETRDIITFLQMSN